MLLESVKKMLWVFDQKTNKVFTLSRQLDFILPTLYLVKATGPVAVNLLIEETTHTEETIGQVKNQAHGALAAKISCRTPPSGERSHSPSALIVSNIPNPPDMLEIATHLDKVRLPFTIPRTAIDAAKINYDDPVSLVNELQKQDWPKYAMLFGSGAVNKFAMMNKSKLSFIYDEIWVVL